MSLDTLSNARADLKALLGTTLGGAPVLDYEPFGQQQGPYVSIFNDGYDDLWWNFTIRVYVNLEPGAREAQVALDTLLPTVVAALDSQWGGPVNWTVGFDEELRALVAALPIHAGRE